MTIKCKNIISLFLLLSLIVISCQSKKYTNETNIAINSFSSKNKFPNNKTAFEKINDQVIFYKPSGNKMLTIDLQSSEYEFAFPDEVYAQYLVKVNDFNYFLPKKSIENYVFSKNNSSTVKTNINKTFTTNDLGLITAISYELPENDQAKKHTTEFTYNKFAQLLKITDSGKTVVENKYDENGNLIESKTSDKQSKYSYDSTGKIVKAEVEKSGEKNIYNYTYNAADLVEKKYTEDQNKGKEFKYNSNGNLIEIIEYSGKIDQSDSKKLINHFVKKTYAYGNNHVSEEKEYEYNIVNASVLVDKKWNPIGIEEQRKLAWKKLNEQSELPLSAIESQCNYQSGQIEIVKTQYNFSNRVKNGKTEQNKEVLDTESIKFTLDSSQRPIKKEITDKNKKALTQEFSY